MTTVVIHLTIHLQLLHYKSQIRGINVLKMSLVNNVFLLLNSAICLHSLLYQVMKLFPTSGEVTTCF